MVNEDLQNGMRITLSSFLAGFPLYKGLEIFDIYAGLDKRDISFNAYCEIDKEITTFTINNTDSNTFKSELKQSGKFLSINATYNHQFTIHCSFLCRKCQKFQRHFLIYGETLRPKKDQLKFIIRKVGQHPAQQINPDKLFLDFLTQEDIELYKKAKMNLSFNYGIGAFAYFRRIVENEVKNVVNNLIKTNQNEKLKLEAALEQFIQDLNIEKLLRHVIIELRNQQSRDAAEKALNNL